MPKIEAKAVTEPVPAGTYKAKIKSSEVVDRVLDNGDKVQYIDFSWEITDGDFKEREIREGMPFNLSVKSTLGKLIKDLTGDEVEVGTEFNTDDLDGTEAEITVQIEEVKARKKGGEPFPVNRIAAVVVKKK